jgi:protein TonB
MTPRLGLALSLLAACGIHAGILLVPRADFLSAPIPTVEIALTDAPPAEAAFPDGRAAPRAPQTTRSAPLVATKPMEPAAAPPPVPAVAPSPQTLVLPVAPQSVSPAPAGGESAPEMSGAPAPPVNADASDGAVASAAGSATSGPTSTTSSNSGAASSPARVPAGGPSASTRSTLIPPQPRASILPVYPRGARTSGLQGVVKVSALVDPSGAVASAEILISSGSAVLDQAALDAVRRAAFTPATQDGLPVACRVIVPIRFQLSRAP